MGVASIKLEGRMKRPEYVATVTNVYRQALNGAKVTRPMMDALHTAFNRQGFTDGYYTGNIGRAMFGIREDTKEDPAWLKEAQQSYESTENSLVPVRFQIKVNRRESILSVCDPEGRVCTAIGPGAEYARTQELTKEALIQRLEKTGGTPFACVEVIAELQPGLMLSAAAINGLRRDVLNQLTALRARRDAVRLSRPQKTVHFSGSQNPPVLTVQVTSREQITSRLLKMNPSVLYIPIHLLSEDPNWCRQLCQRINICAVLPRIIHDKELPRLRQTLITLRGLGIEDVLVGNLGHVLPAREAGMRVRGDFGLNLYNSGSVNAMRDLELLSATLSFEMTLPQIRDVSKGVPCEMIVYGRLPLMLTENCIIQGKSGGCTCHIGPTRLVDKTGAEFPIIKDGNTCRSVLLNGKKLYLLDRHKDLEHLGIWAARLYFTTENPREVDHVLGCWSNPAPFDPGTNTRGLYLRGVE